jgi:hypothetical protein
MKKPISDKKIDEYCTKIYEYWMEKTNIEYGKHIEGGHIFISNWNSPAMDPLEKWIAYNGSAYQLRIGYNDDTIQCADCYQYVDRYEHHCSPYYITTAEGHSCKDCINANIESYIEIFENDNNRCLPSWIDMKKIKALGFICVDDEESDICQSFQNGLHAGMNDTPDKIIKDLNETFGFDINDKYDYLWALTDTSPFHCSFTLYIREN